MKLTFLGATQNVTGSRFLLETGSSRILIDCGMFQERELRSRNWEKFPVEPSTIDTVLLTHAHIDHCGYLPKFIKEGFEGKIITTAPSAEIAKISLLDSAKLQEADAAHKRKRHKRESRKGPHPEVPLYTTEDAINVFTHFRPIEYEKAVEVSDEISATYYEAGHILGAAMIELLVKEGDEVKTIVFSGDIGRWSRPILRDPHLFEKADYVIMEATYGNRLHEDETSCRAKLEAVINETYKKGGNVIIPAFAIGRTQELLYDLNHLLQEERVPKVTVFLDSPMAIKVTEVFEQYSQYFDKEAQKLLLKYEELFDFELLKTTAGVDESKAINNYQGTAVVMAGSGMCTGGRIKHHLIHNIEEEKNTILFVGYQALGTLGRQILERPSEVRILGQIWPVRARIEKINGFSAHADRDELLKWVKNFDEKLQKVFIVHAEETSAREFAETLKSDLKAEVVVPSYRDSVEL